MAIVKMKHLRVVAMVQDREELLRRLQHMGCVEIVQPEPDLDDPLLSSLTSPEGAGLAAAQEVRNEAERALEVLKRYAPLKKGLLSPRPGVQEGDFLDEAKAQKAQKAAEEINGLDRRLVAIRAQESKLEGQRAALEPWHPLDLPLDTASTSQVTVQLGTLPAGVPMNQAQGELQAAGELAELTEVSTDRDSHYCVLVCHTSQAEQALEALKALGWSRANLREWTGTAAENLDRLYQEHKTLETETASIEEKLAGMGEWNLPLRQLSDLASVNASREEARGRLLDSQTAFYLEGWVPAERWDEVRHELDGWSCAYEAEDPAAEEYPSVPVKLKNNWFTSPLSMVTEMYALPAYGSMDPNPLMAPFFILFYGMMLADMGYGLIMVVLSLVIMKKARPKGATMRYMIPLMGLCGVSTFVWGAVTGGFFGDFIPQLLKLINPESTFALPALFSPVDDALSVMVGSLVLGVVQIFTGMALSMYKQIKRGETMAAVCNEGAWFLVFILAGVAAVSEQVMPCVTAILVLLVLTQGYGKKGILGKLMGIFGSLYNNLTGYFSDILSYSRLMALMLAGAVIAQVFNTLGAMTGFIPTFILISFIGNALNFALNILGCYVHDMRLMCLEFFGRFYEDGGKPFRPLDISTQYVDIVKE